MLRTNVFAIHTHQQIGGRGYARALFRQTDSPGYCAEYNNNSLVLLFQYKCTNPASGSVSVTHIHNITSLPSKLSRR